MSLAEKYKQKDSNGKTAVPINFEHNPLLQTDKDRELASRLFALIVESRNSYFMKLRNKDYQELRKWIDAKTPKLNEGDFSYSYSTKCYWILAGLEDFPKCQNPECNKKIGVHQNCSYLGYSDHCSHICKTKDPAVQKKISQTCKSKHGEECTWTSKSEKSKEKRKQTCLKRYGYENIFAVPATIERIAKTIAANHNGNSAYRNHEQGLKTRLEVYGQGSNGKAISKARQAFSKEKYQQITDKTKRTKEALHGDPNYNNPEKAAKTRLQNNNGKWETEDQKERKKQTYLKNFGYDHNFKIPEFRKYLQQIRSSRYLYDGISFDSAPELALYMFLKDHDVNFEYHPDVDLHFSFNGKMHRYFPDFKIGDKFFEIKGNHFFQDKDKSKKMVNPYDHAADQLAEAKHQFMKSAGVVIFTEEEYMFFLQYIYMNYGKDYLRSFKVNKRRYNNCHK